MIQKTIQCCSNDPAFLVTYSVSESEKNYLVCLTCLRLECFSKYITSKTPLNSSENKESDFT